MNQEFDFKARVWDMICESGPSEKKRICDLHILAIFYPYYLLNTDLGAVAADLSTSHLYSLPGFSIKEHLYREETKEMIVEMFGGETYLIEFETKKIRRVPCLEDLTSQVEDLTKKYEELLSDLSSETIESLNSFTEALQKFAKDHKERLRIFGIHCDNKLQVIDK